MSSPLIVWAYDGRVVDLGTGWHEADPDVSVALSDDSAWSGAARGELDVVPGGDAHTRQLRPVTTSGPGRATAARRHGRRREDGQAAEGRASWSAFRSPSTWTAGGPVADLAAPSDDCSGAAYRGRELKAHDLPADVRAAAAVFLEAVTTCDEGKVASFGTSVDTKTNSRQESLTTNEVFALPETDGRTPYATVARLLTETGPVTGRRPETWWTWPRVSKWVNADAAWQEAIDAGAVTEEQAAADRAAGRYTGWQLKIEDRPDPPRKTWSAFHEGDDGWCSRPTAQADPECA